MIDFFNFSNELLCLANSDGYFTRVNPAWTATLGWSEEELLSQPYVDLVHPDDKSATLQEARRLLSTNYQTVRFQNRYRCRDGSYRWLAWMSIRVEEGAIVATARDVTEQQRQAEELRTSEERLRLVMEATSDAIWDVDLRAHQVWWNDVFERCFGSVGPATNGTWDWWMDHIHPEDRQRVMSSLHAQMASDNPHWTCEHRFRRINGKYAFVLNRALLARDSDGTLTRVLGAMQDITAQKEWEQKLQFKATTIRQLFELQERERRLISSDIHDGLAQLIVGASLHLEGAKAKVTDEQAPALKVARHLVKRAIDESRRLISDLRPMIIEDRGITDALRHAIADWQKTSSCQFRLCCQLSKEFINDVFDGVVFRIVQEGVGNALTHGKATTIHINVSQQRHDFCIEIRDNGVGFHMDDVSADRFGLKGITERAGMFGGHARWESAPGRGTRLEVHMQVPPPEVDYEDDESDDAPQAESA